MCWVSNEMEIGTAVEHRVYGKGVVRAFRHSGFECRVEFDLQILLWIPVSQLREIEQPKKMKPHSMMSSGGKGLNNGVVDSAAVPTHPVVDTPQPQKLAQMKVPRAPLEDKQPTPYVQHDITVAPTSRFEARQMVESLRLGVVSENHATRFTLGRESIMEDLCRRLCEPESLPIVLTGEYGCGKTHLLDYLYGVIGERLGFAVARCSLDVNEVGLHQPKNVYRGFVKTFRFTDRDSGHVLDFAGFFKLREVRRILIDHDYFGCIDSDHIDVEVLHWITGQEDSTRPWLPVGRSFQYLPPLYPYQNAANIYTNLLTGLSYACRMVGGRGLVLLFDEAEFLNGPFTAYQLARGRNFLDAIVRCVKEDSEIAEKPISTGLDFTRSARETSFLFRRGADLKVLFAFADSDIADTSSQLKSAHQIKLEPLDSSSYDAALVQVRNLYNQAYNTDFSSEEGDIQARWAQLQKHMESPRLFFKGCVEMFDLARAKRQSGVIV